MSGGQLETDTEENDQYLAQGLRETLKIEKAIGPTGIAAAPKAPTKIPCEDTADGAQKSVDGMIAIQTNHHHDHDIHGATNLPYPLAAHLLPPGVPKNHFFLRTMPSPKLPK